MWTIAIEAAMSEVISNKEHIDANREKSIDAVIEQNRQLELLAIQQDEITEMHNRLIELTEQNDSLQTSVNDIKELLAESESLGKRMSNLLVSAASDRKSINDIHEEIFGYTHENENNEVTVIGLKEQLDSSCIKLKEDLNNSTKELSKISEVQSGTLEAIKDNFEHSLKEFTSDSEKEYDSIIMKINSLLPSALTAGLSGAYIDKIKIEKEELEKHDRSFKKSIITLFSISLLPFAFIVARVLFLSEEFSSVIEDSPMLFSVMLPIYAPILWVAYSSNKSYKLSKRLIEEYTHKEVSSRTFEGLSTQISNIGKDAASGELRIKLLFNLLNVNSENPGKLISDYNNSDHPILDAIDKSSKLTDAIGKLSNVPMINQLLTHLNEKEKEKIDAHAEASKKTFENHVKETSQPTEQQVSDAAATAKKPEA
ncbi:hypothetical protein [Enterovibrio norvegicus]|uniref:hypothetical protein n=2 Tax=Enterovibrio norvegicus TaxID=188144 RepID=UPI00352F979B